MSLPKRYNPNTAEPDIVAQWIEQGVHQFNEEDTERPIYAVDTPPPTVSGNLHLGHVYSYSQADFMARFWRMNGRNVFYPMGYDDNGLPTERLVERTKKIQATQVGRQAFIEACLEVSVEAEALYESLWQRLGLSIDWRYTYRTIDADSRRISQASFIDLYEKSLAYRRKAPAIWCPECQTAIAQAEVDDLKRQSEFVTLAFKLEDGTVLPVATTRPELLAACVAVFVHPDDKRFADYVGKEAIVPHYGQKVTIVADEGADPEKGTGVVMCCTFGDGKDVEWWYKYKLPLIEAINRNGLMTAVAGELANLPITEARKQIKTLLTEAGLILEHTPTEQNVSIHERCDTPVEYIVTSQWFINVLDHKEALIAQSYKMDWHPAHMHSRYIQWVENLNWDWIISRQRYFGIPFPVWYCQSCGETIVADKNSLPIDPLVDTPPHACPQCGGEAVTAETDVMDTWATSSMSPQIISNLSGRLQLPLALRPQAHDIIRTWAFYTIVKAYHHTGEYPWDVIALSGWGLAPEGAGKISKSRGGGPVGPVEMIEQYSADAVRYWAASSGLGKDSRINEEKFKAGSKLVNKLWNVSRFAGQFLEQKSDLAPSDGRLTLADRWLLSRLQKLVARTTACMTNYDYAVAKSETEVFFWTEFADNYLEMVKKRLYGDDPIEKATAQYVLETVVLSTVQLFAPFLPFVTDRIYQGLFAESSGITSVHNSAWPVVDEALVDEAAEKAGNSMVEIASTVRRFKSEQGMGLGEELAELQIQTTDATLAELLQTAVVDLISITRAQTVVISHVTAVADDALPVDTHTAVRVQPLPPSE